MLQVAPSVVGGSKGIAKSSSTMHHLERVSELLQNQKEMIQQMASRLGPVLVAASETPGGVGQERPSLPVELADRICRAADMLEEHNIWLSDLLQRIDL